MADVIKPCDRCGDPEDVEYHDMGPIERVRGVYLCRQCLNTTSLDQIEALQLPPDREVFVVG